MLYIMNDFEDKKLPSSKIQSLLMFSLLPFAFLKITLRKWVQTLRYQEGFSEMEFIITKLRSYEWFWR